MKEIRWKNHLTPLILLSSITLVPLFFSSLDMHDYKRRSLQANEHVALIDPMTKDNYPSHIEICHEIIKETRHQNQHPPGGTNTINERTEVCTSPSTFHALMRILTSTIFSANAESLGLKVNYKHQCSSFMNEDSTIQMHLPQTFVGFMGTSPVDIDNLISICETCIEKHENNIIDENGGNCFLDSTKISNVVPQIVENIRSMALDLLQENGVNVKGTSMVIDDPSDTRFLLSNPYTDAPSHDGRHTSVIYLDLVSHLELPSVATFMGIPLHLFANLIPRSVSNVIILTTDACEISSFHCKEYAKKLQQYLHKLVPRSMVTIENLSSMSALNTIISAEDVICPPGQSCLFPALARRDDTFVVESNEFYPWLRTLPEHSLSHIELLPSSTSKAFGAEIDQFHDRFSLEEEKFILQPPKDRSTCSSVRGRLGGWIKDLDFAERLQYPSPLDHIFGFADARFSPSKRAAYREPTTHRWVEDESISTCQTMVLNRELFCRVMDDLHIRRILFVGDFVGMNQAFSLWKILGNSDSPKAITDRDPNWERVIYCGKELITFQFVRNDKMEENDQEVDLPNKISNCGHLYCYPWTSKYMRYYEKMDNLQDKTLMVASFGPHFYNEVAFTDAFKRFTTSVQEKLSTRLNVDYIYYRNNSPGHDRCNRKINNVPFQAFDEYKATITSKYSWDIHDGFNDIAEEEARGFNRAHDHPHGDTIRILDVYAMTVLRRDGHIGGRDCENCSIANDCFYYSLPGPSDWWNHLLFSNLSDIVPQRNEKITLLDVKTEEENEAVAFQ